MAWLGLAWLGLGGVLVWCVVFCCGVCVVVLCGVLLCGVVVCDVVVFLHGSVSCCVSCDSASQSWVYSAVDLLFRPVESCSTWFRGDVHAWYSFVGIACFYSFAGVGVRAGTVFFLFSYGRSCWCHLPRPLSL